MIVISLFLANKNKMKKSTNIYKNNSPRIGLSESVGFGIEPRSHVDASAPWMGKEQKMFGYISIFYSPEMWGR